MPGLGDPNLLAFAGTLLSRGQTGQLGFGNALGTALLGAAQARQGQIEAQRQQQQDLMAQAQASVDLRAALGQLQQQQEQAEAARGLVGTFEPGSREAFAAGVAPGTAAQNALAAEAPLTQAQQQQLGLQREQLDLERQESAARLQELQQKIALAGKPKSSDVAGLRKEFTAQSKNFADVRDGYKRVLAADDSGAGDVALIFGYMKLLDPGSVVREGEFATAEQTAGVPDRIRNLYNKSLTGERLSPAQRANFAQQAQALYQEQFETHVQQRAGFTQIAQRFGINPEDVLQAVPAPEPDQLMVEAIGNQFDSRMEALKARSPGLDLNAASVLETARKYNKTPDEIIELLEQKVPHG